MIVVPDTTPTPPPVTPVTPPATPPSAFSEAGEPKEILRFKRSNGQEVVLAQNGHLYRQTEGILTAWVPVPLAQIAQEHNVQPDAKAMLKTWEAEAQPPSWALKALHDQLFTNYEKEVLVMHGRDKQGTWVFSVPYQKGSWGMAEIDEDKDQGGAAKALWDVGARPTGITHRHPGDWVGFSTTDETLYRKVNGIHPIISSKGTRVGVYASLAGYIWTLVEPHDILEADLLPPEGAAIKIVYSGNQPLDTLIPKETKVTYSGSNTMGFSSGLPNYGDDDGGMLIGDPDSLEYTGKYTGGRNWEREFEGRFKTTKQPEYAPTTGKCPDCGCRLQTIPNVTYEWCPNSNCSNREHFAKTLVTTVPTTVPPQPKPSKKALRRQLRELKENNRIESATYWGIDGENVMVVWDTFLGEYVLKHAEDLDQKDIANVYLGLSQRVQDVLQKATESNRRYLRMRAEENKKKNTK